jgi:chemotaxis protein methyltransferase CheR
MIGPVRADETERFRAAITTHLGLQFEDGKLGFLADVLQRRLDRLQSASDLYLLALEQGPGDAEIGLLARELTVGETYFFRNIEQFHARPRGIPQLADSVRRLRVRRGALFHRDDGADIDRRVRLDSGFAWHRPQPGRA